MMMIAGVLLAASHAGAFTMGEATAATGVHSTLAGSGTGNAAGTIGTVKRALGAAAATKQGQLEGSGVQVGWGGKGGGNGGWATASSGWSGKGGTGWTTASNSWAAGGASGAWVTGRW